VVLWPAAWESFVISEWQKLQVKDTFFGYGILNNDFQMSELGYFTLTELAEIKNHSYLEVECDPNWLVRPASQVKRIFIAREWPMPGIDNKLEVECPHCKKILVADSASREIWCSRCKIIILQQ